MTMEPSSVGVDRSASLVVELVVGDLAVSLDFWTRLCNFETNHAGTRDALISFGGHPVRLVESPSPHRARIARHRRTRSDDVTIELTLPPIEIDRQIERLDLAEWELADTPVQTWYRVDDRRVGFVTFSVRDPDGYLIRFAGHVADDIDGDIDDEIADDDAVPGGIGA